MTSHIFMVFNSFPFLLGFLPCIVVGYYFLAKRSLRLPAQIFLLGSSILFVGLANPKYLLILFGSIAFNYLISQIIVRSPTASAKRWLVLGLAGNLALLAAFKYLNFFLNAVVLASYPKIRLPDWGFPLGLSFFTLQQIMYLVDCYEGLISPNRILTHAVFVSFFPCVSSGPLTRAKHMAPQILEVSPAAAEKFARGLALFTLGLFKKVVLADSLAKIAGAGFADPFKLSTMEAWLSSLSYTLQIYFDFSGYSDMAIAIAMMLGFTIPINFNSPYHSCSITEFWRRWHITLSNFITTYLYTPMVRGAKKVTLTRSCLATFIAMALVGLWHGPAWTFVIFGCLHGAGLAANQIWRERIKLRVPTALSWTATFLYVNLAFVFFGSANVSSALRLAKSLVIAQSGWGTSVLAAGLGRWKGLLPAEIAEIAGLLICCGCVAVLGKNSNELWKSLTPRFATGFAVALILAIALLFLNSHWSREFVYVAY